MDRIWQWAWDRHGARLVEVACAISFTALLPVYLVVSFLIVALQKSDRYAEAAGVTALAALMLTGAALPGRRSIRPAQQWAAGREVDRAAALKGTYAYARGAVSRSIWGSSVCSALLAAVVAAIAGASGPKLVQYAILGASIGTAAQLIASHSSAESALRPVRVALAGDTDIGDDLPRSRPTFATWTNVAMLGVAF